MTSGDRSLQGLLTSAVAVTDCLSGLYWALTLSYLDRGGGLISHGVVLETAKSGCNAPISVLVMFV